MNKRERGILRRAMDDLAGTDLSIPGVVKALDAIKSIAGRKTVFLKPNRIAAPVKRKRAKPRRGRVIDKPYMAWLSLFPCLICAARILRPSSSEQLVRLLLAGAAYWHPWPCALLGTEVAHVGPRGLGQKCSDRETVPLCRAHHTEGKESERALGKRFWEFHGLDKAEVIAAFNAEYERRAA